MKIIIDLLTPKQCMFFSKLSEHLEARGHHVTMTTRRYREVLDLLRVKGLSATVVGEHGGKELKDKLRAGAERTLKLASLFDELDPDVSVSFSSPETARVSYGLRVPHICINDSPHAEAVARLTVPLSTRLLTPWIIPKTAWTRYGIQPDDVIKYRALDPWVWLRGFKPDDKILGNLGLDNSKPILTIRPEESFASYLLEKTSGRISIISVIEKLLGSGVNAQIVVLPRYQEHLDLISGSFGDELIVPKSAVDAPSLLSFSTAFIGAGGTMSAEAAILGVPTISCYPGESFLVEKYLMRRKLVVRATEPEEILSKINEILDDSKAARRIWAERSKKMIRGFVDPLEIITDEIEKHG